MRIVAFVNTHIPPSSISEEFTPEVAVAIISSIDTFDGVSREEAVLTTPEPEELFMHIRNAANSKMENLVMEVCSQALKIERVYGILYKYGIYLKQHLVYVQV